MNNRRIAIWGTGAYGDIAYYYYRNKCKIEYYIDSNEKKWGEFFNGIQICNPSVIENDNIEIVIAIKYGAESVKKQLIKEYNKNKFTLFRILEQQYMSDKNDDVIDENTIIVSFSGGIGNQMFQYALFRNLVCEKKVVLADLRLCSNSENPEFILTKIFGNIDLNICTIEQRKKLISKNITVAGCEKKFMIYKEANIYETKKKKVDPSILNITGGYLEGWFQSHFFADRIRDILLDDFSFNKIQDEKLNEISQKIRIKNTIGIHIRRGDYLEGNNSFVYGNICTQLYYSQAIVYMKNCVNDAIFCFFSNDINWVKTEYRDENAIFIDNTLFGKYADWYDMYLMSQCKHNIIANSSFSWWGAWLNQNPKKIVIAPKKWINGCIYEDIYPHDWIQI